MNIKEDHEEKELEDMNRFEISLKKHMSTPPPGLVLYF